MIFFIQFFFIICYRELYIHSSQCNVDFILSFFFVCFYATVCPISLFFSGNRFFCQHIKKCSRLWNDTFFYIHDFLLNMPLATKMFLKVDMWSGARLSLWDLVATSVECQNLPVIYPVISNSPIHFRIQTQHKRPPETFSASN